MNRRMASICFALAVLAGLASPAAADEQTLKDAKGDVLVLNETSEGVNSSLRQPDITRAHVEHRSDTVAVFVFYRSLRKKQDYLMDVTIKTPKVAGFTVSVFASSFDGHPEPFLSISGTGEPWECPKAEAHIRYDLNRLFVRIPRKCLASPAWIRVATLSAKFTETEVRIDQVLEKGNVTRPRFGPRLYQ